MKRIFAVIFIIMASIACSDTPTQKLELGIWRGQLQTMDKEVLSFNFKVMHSDTGEYTMEIYNDTEVIRVDEIQIKRDSIIIRLPVYEGYIAGHFGPGRIDGQFIIKSMDRTVPFTAVYGEKERFDGEQMPQSNVTGDWEAEFSPDTENSYMAKGIFKQVDDRVTGTFRTVTGDYRYLDGAFHGDTLRLSTFDGSRAYLFVAKVADSVMEGVFYAGNHFKEPFRAKRNSNFELPQEQDLTYLKEGYTEFDFSFPDDSGKMMALSDPSFEGKVMIVQLMGTWCPNCLDETKFLVDYLKENANKEVGVVALAFEYAKTPELAFKAVTRLKDRIGVTYPILLAQYASSSKSLAADKLPMLNHVLSYPTTIIVDKKGTVRKIYTGFNGPATGSSYLSFKRDFERYIDQLLEENDRAGDRPFDSGLNDGGSS